MGLIFNGNGDVIKAVDGSLTVEGLDLGGGSNIVAGVGTFSGNLNVGGVLTYEDVKNVDSVGIISARQSIHVGYGVSAAGIITATSYRGDGSQLTGITQVGGATTVGFDDNKSIYFGSQDDYRMGWSGTTMSIEPTSSSTTQILHLTSNNQMYIKSKASGLFLMSGNQQVIDLYGGYGGGIYFKNNNTQYLKLEYGNWTFQNNTEVRIPDKLVHAGDENTSIRFPAADTVTVETAGSERLRIASTGQVLLGATNPSGYSSRILTVAAADNDSVIEIRTATDHAGQIAFSDGYAADTTAYRGYIQYDHSSDYMRFATASTERLRIDSSGRLLLGTTTEGNANADDLTVATTGTTGVTIRSGTSNTGNVYFSDATSGSGEFAGAVEYDHSSNSLRLHANSNERLRITSGGAVLIGHTAVIGHNGVDGYLQVTGTGTDDSSLNLNRFSADNWCPFITFGKSRNGTKGGHTVVQNGDYIGYIQFAASDGTDFNNSAANIICQIDGTPGTNDTPGRLMFQTCADGTNSPTERLRITSAGKVGINETSPQQQLHVHCDTAYEGIFINGSGAPNICFAANTGTTSQWKVGIPGQNNTYFGISSGNGNTNRLLIDANGKTGIGNLPDTEVLTIGGGQRWTYQSTNWGAGTEGAFIDYHSSTGVRIGHVSGASGSAKHILFYSGGNQRGQISSNGSTIWGPSSASASNMQWTTDSNQIPHFFWGGPAGSGQPTDGAIVIGSPQTDICSQRVGTILFGSTTSGGSGNSGLKAGINCVTNASPGSDFNAGGNLIFQTKTNNVSIAEKMRLNSNGKLLVGRTSDITITGDGSSHVFEQNTNNGYALATHSDESNKRGIGIYYSSTSGASDAIRFAIQSAAKFIVLGSGNCQNANNSYGSISDASLKENIVDAGSQWNDIKNIKIRNFNFKESSGQETHKQIGVVAQELETVCPKLISTGQDGFKNVSSSVLYMKAVKALQESMARIETLEAEVAALKSA